MRFGVNKLDELVGEIVVPSVIVIEGLQDIQLILAREFLKNVVKKGYKIYAITSERVKRFFEDLKAEVVTPNDRLSLRELFTLSLVVKDMENNVGVIDVLNQIFLMHEPQTVYNLFREVCKIVREKKGVALITLDKRVFDEKSLAMLEMEADYVVEIDEIVERFKVVRGIRVKKSATRPPSEFYALKLSESGVEVGDKLG